MAGRAMAQRVEAPNNARIPSVGQFATNSYLVQKVLPTLHGVPTKRAAE